MMAATQQEPVVVSKSSDALSDTENSESLELELKLLLYSVIKLPQIFILCKMYADRLKVFFFQFICSSQ